MLLGAFWVQLAAGATLIVVGPLLASQLRGERLARTRRARAAGRHPIPNVSPPSGRGLGLECHQIRAGGGRRGAVLRDRPGLRRGPRARPRDRRRRASSSARSTPRDATPSGCCRWRASGGRNAVRLGVHDTFQLSATREAPSATCGRRHHFALGILAIFAIVAVVIAVAASKPAAISVGIAGVLALILFLPSTCRTRTTPGPSRDVRRRRRAASSTRRPSPRPGSGSRWSARSRWRSAASPSQP